MTLQRRSMLSHHTLTQPNQPTMTNPTNFGIIEMLFSSAVVLGFCAWQYWLVRDAGKPSPKDPGHAEGEHEADDG
jgi:hypothetical protein